MNDPLPFRTIDWSAEPVTEHPGDTGTARWRTRQFPGLRIRLVEYSAGYRADHWCTKGHIVHCLEGEFSSELRGGESLTLKQGTSYVVSDDMSAHRSETGSGALLLIIDGEFLHRGTP